MEFIGVLTEKQIVWETQSTFIHFDSLVYEALSILRTLDIHDWILDSMEVL